MDLTTTYLGLTLKSPLVPSSSPLSEEVDNIKRMEDAGAAAVVMHSLFEEQLIQDRYELHHHLTHGTESFAEALTYFPEPEYFHIGPELYLNHIQAAKAAVNIPIIASLNGDSLGGWIDYASQIQQAGADALELNIYFIPTDLDTSSAEVEQTYLDILQAVRSAVTIPIAVKLSPFFSSTANMAKRLVAAGANGLVLFNRFYQPDINLESLEVQADVQLSGPDALRLPLTWIGLLYGRLAVDLAATSGIHKAEDVLKVTMAGAKVAMLCSLLLRHGIEHIRVIEEHLREWMTENEYESIQQMQGSLSQIHCPDPSAFERAQYVKTLHTTRPEWLQLPRPNYNPAYSPG